MKETNLFTMPESKLLQRKEHTPIISCFEEVKPKTEEFIDNYFVTRQGLKTKLDKVLEDIGNREMIQIIGANQVGKTIVASYIKSKFSDCVIVRHTGMVADSPTAFKDLGVLAMEHSTTIIDNLQMSMDSRFKLNRISDIKNFYIENKYDVTVINLFINEDKDTDIKYIK